MFSKVIKCWNKSNACMSVRKQIDYKKASNTEQMNRLQKI